MPHQVIPADKTLRTLFILGLLLLTVVPLLLVRFFQAYFGELKDLLETQPDAGLARARTLLTVVAVVHGLLSSCLGFYLLTTGVKVWIARRYPLEGQRVIRSTVLREGKSARIVAGAHVFIAALLLLSNGLIIRLVYSLSTSMR